MLWCHYAIASILVIKNALRRKLVTAECIHAWHSVPSLCQLSLLLSHQLCLLLKPMQLGYSRLSSQELERRRSRSSLPLLPKASQKHTSPKRTTTRISISASHRLGFHRSATLYGSDPVPLQPAPCTSSSRGLWCSGQFHLLPKS